MDDTVIIENDPDLPDGWVYFVTATEDNIRPYGLIFTKILSSFVVFLLFV